MEKKNPRVEHWNPWLKTSMIEINDWNQWLKPSIENYQIRKSPLEGSNLKSVINPKQSFNLLSKSIFLSLRNIPDFEETALKNLFLLKITKKWKEKEHPKYV